MPQALRDAMALLPILTPPSYLGYTSQSLRWWQEESVVWAQRASIPSKVSFQPGEVPRVRPQFLST